LDKDEQRDAIVSNYQTSVPFRFEENKAGDGLDFYDSGQYDDHKDI
jgi:hypothetical protein